MKIILFSCILFIGILFPYCSYAQEERTQWWQDSRFGMFIHWGLYSGAEGIWKGEPHRHFNNYAEWIKYRNRIGNDAYGELAKRFDWESINPEDWVILAKNAGMKYITITAKHHDGFALWDTQVGNYSFKNFDPNSRDVIKELAEACKKHGMKLGFYYSHWVDWEHPYGWDHNRELSGDLSTSQFDIYWQEKVVPQIRELLTNYGDIALLWFDMWIPHQETIVTEAQLRQIITLVRTLQPNCLINSRLGLSVEDPDIDYETLGDNQLGAIYKKNPWQTPGTIAHSWGYHALERDWKSSSELLHALINNVSLNGNFMLNIGPRANGDVPYESVSRLNDMGNWLAINGESIYGASGLELKPKQHDWGKITYKQTPNGHKVYLHVFNWPIDGILRVTGITEKPEKVYLLHDKLEKGLVHEQSGPLLHVKVPKLAPEPLVSVVVLEFQGIPTLDTEVVAESTFGGFSLNPGNSLIQPLATVKTNRFSPAHLVIDDDLNLEWKVFIKEPGNKKLSISYSNENKKPVTIQIEFPNGEIKQFDLTPTGKMVVEPNQNLYTEEFVEFPLGEIDFPSSGEQLIKVKIRPSRKNPLRFNWIWIGDQ